MIQSIQLHPFKGVQKGELNNFSKINVLTGIGKSSVLEAIYLASTVKQKETLFFQNQQQSVLLPSTDLLKNISFELIRNIYPDSTWQPQRQGRFIKGSASIPFLMEFEVESTTLKDKNFGIFGVEDSDFSTQIWGSVLENSRLLISWYPNLCYHQQTARWVVTGQLATPEHVLFYKNRHSNLAFDHLKLIHPDYLDCLQEHFGNVIGNRDLKLHISDNSISFNNQPSIPLCNLSGSALSVFNLLMPLVHLARLATPASPGLLLWDLPEDGKDSKTLLRLLSEVIKIIENLPIQVVIATSNQKVVTKLKQKETKHYHLQLSSGIMKSIVKFG